MTSTLIWNVVQLGEGIYPYMPIQEALMDGQKGSHCQDLYPWPSLSIKRGCLELRSGLRLRGRSTYKDLTRCLITA